MSITTAVEDGTLPAVFDRIRDSLQAERRRTRAEIAAFEEFGERVANLQLSAAGPQSRATQPTSSGPGATVAVDARPPQRGPSADPAESIRNAYAETVMSLPFYEAEYGEPYSDNIRAELGRDLGAALTESACIGPACREALQQQLAVVRTERRNLIETCEREEASAEQAATDLRPLADELNSVAVAPAGDRQFGALEAEWTRLGAMLARLEDVAADRQAVINGHRDQYRLPVDGPDLCAYLYADLPTTYPVLSLCGDLARDATELRDRVEKTMQAVP